jgi:group I intron endonuclease
MFIYKITNLINNKIYIGKTVLSIKRRWYYHIRFSQRNLKSKSLLYDAIRKYGKENFKIEILFTLSTEEELNEKEKQTIKEMRELYGKENIYNIVDGGTGGDTGLGGKTYVEMYGEEKAIELKEKRSKFFKNRVRTKEHCENISKSRLGTKATEETKQKLSKLHIGENNSFYNKHHTEETKALLSEIGKNREDIKGENSHMHGTSLYKIWLEKYGKEEADKRMKASIEKCKETKKKNGTNRHSEETKQKMKHPHSKGKEK